MDKVIIYGTGPFAEQVKFKFEDEGIDVVAFTEGKQFKTKDAFLDLPVYEFETLNNEFSQNSFKIFVAVGYTKLNSLREEICREVMENGFTLFSFISSKANISKTAVIGKDVFISEGVYIGIGTILGDGVVILPNVTFGDNIVIKDYVYISLSAALGGNVIVDKNCFIGINATVRDGIKIGTRNIIGSAANITKDTKNDSVYVGNPARKIDKKASEVNI